MNLSQTVCIHHLFEKQALLYPDDVALVFEEKKLSYAELNHKANQVARFLQRQGVVQEARVGLYVERSMEMVIGLLGILKAGAAYVPLDPIYPKERLAYMVECADCVAVLTQSHLKENLTTFTGHMTLLDSDWDNIASESIENLAQEIRGENLAYVIFTSGSTGRPKGVQIQHDGVVNFLKSMAEKPGLSKKDVLLAVTIITFDIAVLEIFLPLSVGAVSYLVRRETALDGNKLIQTLEQSGATVMQATPATWRLLINSGWEGTTGLKMLCGGETMSPELASQLLRRGKTLWNMYGPTETSIWSSVYQVKKRMKKIPIGKPIHQTEFYIFDENHQLVASGQKGELYIGGIGVARGYVNMPELTSEKFISNSFSEIYRRLYKTGDLARRLPDGNIEFFGRNDYQVKIRGFRIELSEVESVFLEHEAIKQAAIIVQGEDEDDKRLVAYLVANQNKILPQNVELQSWLKKKLPHYMIPSGFFYLKEFPLMPNGKLDRSKLPMVAVAFEAKTQALNLENPTQKKLYELWCRLLGISAFGIDDTFFDLGGNSLLAIRFLAEIKKNFNLRIPPAVLLEKTTIRLFSELLDSPEALAKYTLSPIFSIQAEGTKPPLFCVAGIYGDVIAYRQVASVMDTDQPMYGLQIAGYEVKTAYKTIEQLASDLIKSMQKSQPKGPYSLIGFSFGAYVAFEMAQQLRACGEKIAYLCLIDSHSPVAFSSVINNILFSIRLLCNFPIKLKLRYIRNAFIALRREMVKSFKRAVFNLLPAFSSTLFSEEAKRYIMIANYKAKFYAGKMVLLQSQERILNTKYRKCIDSYMGWEKLASEVEVYDIPGLHNEILRKPYATPLAEALMRSLKNITAPSREI